MKKSFKGFTLIECLVALAILGMASLTMAQIYAAVATRNKMNHLVNTSLSNQVAYVEQYNNPASKSETVAIKYGNGAGIPAPTPPHLSSTASNDNYLTVTKNTDGMAGAVTADQYSFPVDIYVLKSRDRDDNDLESSTRNAGYTEADYNLRYKYLEGHT